MKKALCIGINNYPGTDMDLAGCVNDAKDWAKALRARGFSVATLLDNKATRAAELKAFKSLVDKAAAGDLIVITNSSHGTYIPDRNGDEPDKRDECLVPYDIMTAGPVVDDEIFEIFKAKKRGIKVVLISDSCHSGTVLRAFGEDEAVAGAKKRFMPPRVFMKSMALSDPQNSDHVSADDVGFRDTDGVLLLLAGCADSEYSYDASFKGRPNGAFTYFAIQALKQMPEGASYYQWFKLIQKALPNKDYPQSPNLMGAGQRTPIFG